MGASTTSNIYVDQGTDFSVDLDIYDDAGELMDVSTCTFESKAKKVWSRGAIDFVFGIEPAANVVGKVVMSLPANTTVSIIPGKYQYDVVMSEADSSRKKILDGIVFILPTISGYSE